MSLRDTKFGKSSLVIPATAAVSLALDIWSKDWARRHLTHGLSEPFIPGFLQLTLTANSGAAFSLGSGNSALMALLASAMTIALVAWAINREFSKEPFPITERIGMGCLLGGALGNLCDRFFRGKVTDFLEFSFVTFPVFNAADVLIDVGIGLLIIAALMRSDKDDLDKVDSDKDEVANDSDDKTVGETEPTGNQTGH